MVTTNWTSSDNPDKEVKLPKTLHMQPNQRQEKHIIHTVTPFGPCNAPTTFWCLPGNLCQTRSTFQVQNLHKSHLLGTKSYTAEKHVLPEAKLALSPRMQHLENECHCYLVTH